MHTLFVNVAMDVNSLMSVFVQEWAGMCKAPVMTHHFIEPKAKIFKKAPVGL